MGKRKHGEEQYGKIKELYLAGETYSKIAQTTGLSKSIINGIVNRLDLPKREPIVRKEGRPSSAETRRKIAAALATTIRPPEPPPRVEYKPPVLTPPAHCQWPTGEGKKIKFNCHKAIAKGSSYCEDHRAMGVVGKTGAT